MTSSSLCKYRDFFGKPREGAHSYRLFDIAVVDVLATVLMAYLTTLLLGKKNLNLAQSLLLWFALAFVMHSLFCVKSKLSLAR